MNKEQREIVSVTGRLLWLACHHRGVLHTQLDDHERTMLAAHTLLVDMLEEEFAAISGARRKMKDRRATRRQSGGASLVRHDACSDAGSSPVASLHASPFQEGPSRFDATPDDTPSSCDVRQEEEVAASA